MSHFYVPTFRFQPIDLHSVRRYRHPTLGICIKFALIFAGSMDEKQRDTHYAHDHDDVKDHLQTGMGSSEKESTQYTEFGENRLNRSNSTGSASNSSNNSSSDNDSDTGNDMNSQPKSNIFSNGSDSGKKKKKKNMSASLRNSGLIPALQNNKEIEIKGSDMDIIQSCIEYCESSGWCDLCTLGLRLYLCLCLC
jgi:hypothetical protein